MPAHRTRGVSANCLRSTSAIRTHALAYGRAGAAFLDWCEARGLRELATIQPVHVAAYIEELGRERYAPTVKRHLACIGMLFDWLVIGQVGRAAGRLRSECRPS